MKHTIYILLVFAGLFYSCKKSFLEKIPDKNLATPTTLPDFQSLLDNTNMYSQVPALGDAGTDDYYANPSTFVTDAYVLQNAYKWNPDTYAGGSGNTIPDWNYCYNAIYTCNIVLEEINKITVNEANKTAFNAIRGSALFYRAFNYFNLSQLFTLPYSKNTANSTHGLPIKLSSNLNTTSTRSTLTETYNQIISDLNSSTDLLPTNLPNLSYINRPSKVAVYALLTKTYLVMQDYDKALENANNCLNLYNIIGDYNQVSGTPKIPFTKAFPEIIIYAYNAQYLTLLNSRTFSYADSTLFKSYDDNDLRKTLYFSPSAGKQIYRGAYTGDASRFGGLATDEVLLTKAECEARKGNTQTALDDLNNLLVKRWKTGTFIKKTAGTPDEALSIILTERRKELVLRNTRWSDLRRLNLETRNAKTLTRTIGAQTFSLAPNDKRYALLIPTDEIQLAGLPQNER